MSKLFKLFSRRYYTSLPEVVYELKPGGHYLIEFSARAVTKDTVEFLAGELSEAGIHVLFVANPTNHRAFEPVPATPNKSESH